MHLLNFAWLLCAISSSSLALDPTHLVYEFPNGTWVENLVVRPSGSLLLTIHTAPDLYQLNPLAENPKARLVHHFSASSWLMGITEVHPNTYYVIGANGTWSELPPVPGSNRIYRVHFREFSSEPEISLTATLPDAVFLNGLTTLNPATLLAADSGLGVIWAIDITTGASRIAIKDPLMAPTIANPVVSVNGIKIYSNHTLYFTNTAQLLLATIPINADGTAAGPAIKIASAAPGTYFDDFALDRYGDAFLATGSGDSVAEVKRDGSQSIIAGVEDTTEFAQPTAAQFGRTVQDGQVLYVTTAGGLKYPVDGHIIIGGQVVAVDT